MSETGEQHATRVVPLMRYRDLPGAISWLAEAFGFEAHYTATDEDGKLIYAQMVFGNGMVMLGPVRDSDFDDLLSQPDEIGGTETQSCYLVVEDIESHYERAKAAGAEIALDVQSDETGGRAYSCRDCEGHLWNFGTFNPWKSAVEGTIAVPTGSARKPAGPMSMGRSAAAVFAGLAVAGVAIGIYTNHSGDGEQLSKIQIAEPKTPGAKPPVSVPVAPVRVVSALRKELQDERAMRREAEQRLANTRRELAMVKAQAQDAVATTRRVSVELEEARGAEQAALSRMEHLRSQHVRELKVANASADDLRNLIQVERELKEKALKAAEDVKYELVLERQLRQQAERNAETAQSAARQAARDKVKRDAENRKVSATPQDGGLRTGAISRNEAPRKATVTATTPTPTKGAPKVSDKKPVTKNETTSKVSAVEPSKTENATEKQEKNEPAKPKITAKPAPKKTYRRTYRKKPAAKPAPKPNRNRSYGVSKGWPYNTW